MDRHPAHEQRLAMMTRLCLTVPLAWMCLGLSGCTAILSPINSIPADRVPPQFLAEPRANRIPIDIALLGQQRPEHYLLDAGDVLGVYIEGMLGVETQTPPVQFPEPGSDLDPSMGYPMPIREDGTISLPALDPIVVRGLTVAQAEELVKKKYVEAELLVQPRIIVTLMRKRTHRVFVVRQDNTMYNDPRFGIAARGRGVFDRPDLSSRGFVLQMPAYENDVLNALTQTGGLPGLNARNEVKVLRAERNRAIREQRLMQVDPRFDPRMYPYGMVPPMASSGTELVIPLRLRPGEAPRFRPEDVILHEGDVVMVETRDTEVYYTGGLLGGGEWPLPRDYDLDVLGAMALAGQGIGVGRPNMGGLVQAVGTVPPSELIVLRKLPGNQQLPIRVDLTEAINDPQARLLVAPGDTLILRFKPEEELTNFGIAAFFTFGIRELLRR